METFRMSRKEAPRPGLLKAALVGRIRTGDGARALDISARHFRRLKARFRDEGLTSVPHGLRGRPSNRHLDPTVQARVATLMRTTYAGFNDVHLTEKLCELHGLALSRASVRRPKIASSGGGVWGGSRRRGGPPLSLANIPALKTAALRNQRAACRRH